MEQRIPGASTGLEDLLLDDVDTRRLLREVQELLQQSMLIKHSLAKYGHAGADVIKSCENIAAQTLALRRLRDSLFPEGLFADPAWDILLDLYHSEKQSAKVCVSSACIAAAVPATTGLRHIRILQDAGLIDRVADTSDGRRIFLSLTPRAKTAMDQWVRVAASPFGANIS